MLHSSPGRNWVVTSGICGMSNYLNYKIHYYKLVFLIFFLIWCKLEYYNQKLKAETDKETVKIKIKIKRHIKIKKQIKINIY